MTAKTDLEEKEEKKMLDRDMDDIGEGSARGTVRVCRGRTPQRSKYWGGGEGSVIRFYRGHYKVGQVLRRGGGGI